jgi:hypothetical protein
MAPSAGGAGPGGISDDDERLHAVEDPSPHWSDSLYFNAWDPATSTFLMTRIAVLSNARRVTAGMLVWQDGVPVYAYGQELADIPPTDWDVMDVGGITYRMLSAGQAWAVQLADGGQQAHLEWEGLGPAVSYDAHPAGPLPRAVAWGHYEQTCRVKGDLIVGGERVRFDGFGQRDHSWGFRHWAGLHQWHWITGFLADGRGFNVFEVQSHQDVTTVNGFVQTALGQQYVVGAHRDLDRSTDGGAERYELTLGLGDGEVLQITGDRAGGSIPVRPAEDQPVVVHETPMRLSAAGPDGMTTEGYGIYEHLVTEFD